MVLTGTSEHVLGRGRELVLRTIARQLEKDLWQVGGKVLHQAGNFSSARHSVAEYSAVCTLLPRRRWFCRLCLDITNRPHLL